MGIGQGRAGTGSAHAGPDGARQGRAVPDRTGQGQEEPDKAWKDRTGSEMVSQCLAGLDRTWHGQQNRADARRVVLGSAGPGRSIVARPRQSRSCLALLCSILPGAALSGLVQSCMPLPCSTLPGAVRSGPVRPCATLSGSALLYPLRRCPVRPHPAPPGAALPLLCLALPGLALSGTVLPIPIQSCRALSNPSGPAWHCSALFGVVLFHPARFMRPCLALPWSTLPGTALSGPVRHCLALSSLYKWF